MKSLRNRMALWFGISFILLMAALLVMANRLFDAELRGQNWCQIFPDHPDWVLHGNYSEAEVKNLTRNLTASMFIGSLPIVALSVGIGFWLARKSLRPIASVNQQLHQKTATNLGEPIQIPEIDMEFRDLVRQLNELLSRLDVSFNEMNTYAAKVAHELRTPLAIMRLKVERADGRIAPELAEELENELHRLTYVVDQSLFIAHADRGRVPSETGVFNLSDVVRDVVGDFQLLAADQGRSLALDAMTECWMSADVRHVRQIIHNLLTNALKHGQGNLIVRVNRRSGNVRLLIVNRTSPKTDAETATLGLGLRVVAALLRLEPGIHYQRRHGKGYYVARLQSPAILQPEPVPGLARNLKLAGT
jgi:signal transduction histidine kinase